MSAALNYFSPSSARDAFAALPGNPPLRTQRPPRCHTYVGSGTPPSLRRRLDAEVADLPFPTDQFRGLDVYGVVTDDESRFHEWSAIRPGREEVVVAIRSSAEDSSRPGGNRSEQSCYVATGGEFRQICRELLDRRTDRQTSVGIDAVLGSGGWKVVAQLAGQGSYLGGDTLAAIGMRYLALAVNSLRSLGTVLFTKLRAEGWLTDDLAGLARRALGGDYAARVSEYARAAMTEAGASPDSLLTAGQLSLNGLFDTVADVLRRAPALPWLVDQLYGAFEAVFRRTGRLYETARRFAAARETFDDALRRAAGETLWKEIADGLDVVTQAKAGRLVELGIGGAMIGQLPFLVGTIYQIVADILTTVIGLFRYGFYALRGAASYLVDVVRTPAADAVGPAPELLSALFGDFNVETFLSRDVPALLSGLAEFGAELLESFLTNAETYGRTVGRFLADGLVMLGDGALSLMSSGYPSGGSLVERIWWNVRQWFNIGTLLGPIIVDVVLMFCSGGTTGVFSAAAKLGKLGKAGEAFRFVRRGAGILDAAGFVTKLPFKVPAVLRDILSRLLHQAWAIASKVSDTLTTLLAAANAKLGGVAAAADVEAIGRRLDALYDVAGVGHLVLSLSFMVIGLEDAEVTPAGQITAT